MKYETFQQKLDRFMKEPVGFLVKSVDIAAGLAKVFEKKHMKPRRGCTTMALAMGRIWNYAKDSSYVTYNYRGDRHELSGGSTGYSGTNLELLDVTLDELKEYLKSFPQTLEDKLKLFKAGTHVLHVPTQEIYDKLMVELGKRGYKWHNPVDSRTYHRYWNDNKSVTIVCCGVFDGNEGVTYDELGGYSNANREVLELTLEDFKGNKQEDHMKITIETDGHHKTTAECNGVTAESLCNPTDEFKLPKGVHMAVQRLLEKLEEPEGDTGFHVGDIVEVVANEFDFSGNPIGLQGVVASSVTIGAAVKIPIYKSPMHFYNRELKLIRRGNN